MAKPDRVPSHRRDDDEPGKGEVDETGREGRGTRAPRGSQAGLRGIAGHHGESAPLDLDRLIHERMRLGIVSALAVNDALTFTDLKALMGTSDGNLSVHARKLEDAGYIACAKSFDGRVPRTEYRITPTGRAALERYLDHMEALIHATRER